MLASSPGTHLCRSLQKEDAAEDGAEVFGCFGVSACVELYRETTFGV